MKLALAILLFLIQINCQAQLKEDKSIKNEYELILKNSSSGLQDFINQQRLRGENESITTVYVTDTLNKNEIDTSFNSTQIFDPETGKENIRHEEQIEFPMPWAAQGILVKDTLIINTGLLMPISSTKIYGSKVITVWEDHTKYDKVFRLNLRKKKSKDLYAPVQNSNIVLSNIHPEPGEIVYGKLEFTTVPFYVDNINFIKKYISQQVRLVCYFKVKIKKE
jgi:hypothetical protein